MKKLLLLIAVLTLNVQGADSQTATEPALHGALPQVTAPQAVGRPTDPNVEAQRKILELMNKANKCASDRESRRSGQQGRGR